ncbi:MAG: hypothetical protein P1V20_12880 [Verrucomicrobiales bacterium]|nr:hypothetical protein [Verrucomicrobiales bacterium]
MKIDTPSRQKQSDPVAHMHPYHEGETIPFAAPAKQPMTYRNAKTLVLENGAQIASHICLKTGNPVGSHIKTAVRNPLNPGTWFKATDTAIIGLSKKEVERFHDRLTSAHSMIILGALLVPTGYVTGLIVTILGVITLLSGLVLRAIFPIWTFSSPKSDRIVIHGCGEAFLDLFPAEPVNKRKS